MSDSSLSSIMPMLDGLVDWERRDRSAMCVDTKPVRDLLERLGSPQTRFRAVHVTGTKGKGSVCALVDAGLRRAGLATGRFASPHVERINERIALNGQQIGDGPLAWCLSRALAARQEAVVDGTAGREASWFDVWTAAAFLSFAEHHVDWAVVECGVGGLRDSTNVLDADVAVLTNVDLEHTSLLGSTCEAIAKEKLGILSPGKPLVTGVSRYVPLGSFVSDVARSRGGHVVYVETLVGEPLQSQNARLADAVLALLHLPPLDKWTIDSASLPGRQEVFYVPSQASDSATIPVVLDGAHVPSSLSALLYDLDRSPRLRGPCAAVIGLGADKDMQGMVRALMNRVVTVLATASQHGAPARDPLDLACAARRCGLQAVDIHDPQQAVFQAINEVRTREGDGWVLVTGSLHLIGVVRPYLRELCRSPATAYEELAN